MCCLLRCQEEYSKLLVCLETSRRSDTEDRGCVRIYTCTHTHTYIYICMNVCIYDAGLPHPPSPPTPWYPPLPVKWVVVLFGLVAFPVWSCLASSPPPFGEGPVVCLVGPAPPVGGSVFYRGMVWLLPLVSSNVIVTCLVPSPSVGWGL